MNQSPNKYEKRANLGKTGEDIACAYLQEHGFTISRRNWRSGHKEIDIIAEKNRTLHFVEVKTRSSNSIISPQEAVTMKKQQLVIRAAGAYIRHSSFDGDVQFDIISIVTHNGSYELEYIPNAFYPLIGKY
ncbi:MAG: YraN family protein [Bacteroidales bacterium]|jgi:putative endonuclease|nr:YraN family protein [Bacteroidales bacterium]